MNCKWGRVAFRTVRPCVIVRVLLFPFGVFPEEIGFRAAFPVPDPKEMGKQRLTSLSVELDRGRTPITYFLYLKPLLSQTSIRT